MDEGLLKRVRNDALVLDYFKEYCDISNELCLYKEENFKETEGKRT